jgi:hypothetical protein
MNRYLLAIKPTSQSIVSQLTLKVNSARHMLTAHIVPKTRKRVWPAMVLKVRSMKKGLGTILLRMNKRRQIASSQRLELGWNTYLGRSTKREPHCSHYWHIARARAKIGMRNLVYNMRRMVQSVKHDATKAIPQLDSTMTVASLAA